MISFFLTGPNNKLEDEIEKIVREHEALNRNHKAILKVIDSTTEGCAIGTTKHTYSLELIHVDDLKEEKEEE